MEELSYILFIVLLILAIARTFMNRVIYNQINPDNKFWMIWDIAKKGGVKAYVAIVVTFWWFADPNDGNNLKRLKFVGNSLNILLIVIFALVIIFKTNS